MELERNTNEQKELVQEEFPLVKKTMVYISHPSGGLEENAKDIERIVEALYRDDELFEKYNFVSPVHCFGFMYETYKENYLKGLQFCLDLLLNCDRMLVFGDYTNSRGCNREIEVANEKGIKYLCFEDTSDMEAVISKIKELL